MVRESGPIAFIRLRTPSKVQRWGVRIGVSPLKIYCPPVKFVFGPTHPPGPSQILVFFENLTNELLWLPLVKHVFGFPSPPGPNFQEFVSQMAVF